MLSVSTATMQHYISDESLRKDIEIKVFTGPKWNRTSHHGTYYEWFLGNEEIVAESFELEQNLCDREADFVGCVSSLCKFKIYEDRHNGAYRLPTLGRYMVEVRILANNCDPILVFTGYSSDSDCNFMNGEIECTCYDLIGTDWLGNWGIGELLWTELNDHPMRVTEILNFLEYRSDGHLKFYYESPDFFTNIYLETNDCIRSMKGLDILKYICQINGLFGVINNKGEFEFRKINNNGSYSGTYPSTLTYPSETLYPGFQNSGMTGDFILLPYESMESYDRMSFEEPPIDGVLIMETESTDINKEADNRKDVSNYDDGAIQLPTHVIKVVGNPFLHNRPSSFKRTICDHIQNNAGGYSYYNYTAKGKGLPFVEVGDYVDYIVTDWNKPINTRHERKSCLVLHRKLKGLQHMTDEYSASTVDEKEWNRQGTVYLCALSGATSVENDIRDSDYEDTANDIAEDVVDEKLENITNVWNVKTVDEWPSTPDPLTIYFIRGMVLMHGHSETEGGTDDIEIPDDTNDGDEIDEGQTDE